MTKLIFFIFTLLILSCNSENPIGNRFNTASVNIDLNIKELIKPATKVELTHAIKYKNKFYCFFEETWCDDTRDNIKFCFVFSVFGYDLKRIKVPDDVQNTFYFDLFVNNDKVLVKTYMDSKTFYFDEKKSAFVKTKNADDLIFEDEKYYVYSLDFGEWGGKTWFKDKKTGLEYEIEVTTPLVNKIGDSYYLTSPYMVLKIENPLKLNKCDDRFTYENIEKDAMYACWYGKLIGYKMAYRDTTHRDYFNIKYKPRIVSSFVCNNELLHIYETDTAIYIAKADSIFIEPIQKIGNKLNFYNYNYSYRSKIQKDGQQLLKFNSNKDYCLMEIKENNIITYNLKLK